MANCKQCGTELPVFTFGESSDLCAACRKQAPAQKPNTMFGALPRLYPSASGWLTATNLLLAANCGVFLAMCLTGVSPVAPTGAQLVKWGADFGPLTLSGQYWRLVTSAFVHIGLVHIAFNMYFLFRFGRALEKLFSAWIVISIYLVTATGASLLSLTWDSTRVSAGASGALFGFIGVLISVLSNKRLGLAEDDRRRMLGYTVRLAVFNLLYGLLRGIDNMAHLGGFVTGLAIGYFIAPSLVSRIETSFTPATSTPETSLAAMPGQGPVLEPVSNRQRNVLVVAAAVVAILSAMVVRAKVPEVELLQGDDLVRKSQCDAALPHLRKAVAGRPNNAEGHGLLGYCLSHMDKDEEAQSEYERSLAIDPDQDWIQVNLAIMLVGKDDARAALLFGKGISTVTPDAENYKFYARALKATGKMDEALEAYRRAFGLNIGDKETERELSELQKDMQTNDSASNPQTLKELKRPVKASR